MTATDIKSSFREMDLNERIKLLGELWDEVSTEPALFDLSDDERTELERRYTEHHESPETSRSWADVLAGLRGRH
jgi:putative addiction module component (TIGR02574 family)